MAGRRFVAGIGVLLLMGLACAKQGFPPGGPEDKTPPDIVSVFPPEGATGVDPGTTVKIDFSEWMDKRSVKESIFISPIPKHPPRMKVKAKTVEIDFVGGLSPQQTYVITVGTGVKDGHGNRLASSWSLAFSTGDRIDRGGISGQVFWPEGDMSGTYAWAYVLEGTASPDPGRDGPDYITQTDAAGVYSFVYLSPGRYRLFAFLDGDKNGTYTVEKDPLGVPTHDVILRSDQDEVRDVLFTLAVQDTTGPECLSVVATHSTHMALRLSEAIDPGSIGTIRISEIDEGVEESLTIRERHLDVENQRRCHVVTELQRPGARYQVHLCGVTDEAGNRVTSESCLVTVEGTSVPDTVCPRIVGLSPADSATRVPLAERIEYRFSEALDTAGVEQAFRVHAGDGQPLPGTVSWPDAATFLFVPGRRLDGASAYTVSLDPAMVRDMRGNPLSDTMTSTFFTTLDPEALGSLSGSISDEETTASGELYVTADQVEDRRVTYTATVPGPGPYALGDLLPGRYVVRAFRDEDGNGSFTSGRPRPVVFSERFSWYPDTVEVRSRWETQDIDLILRGQYRKKVDETE